MADAETGADAPAPFPAAYDDPGAVYVWSPQLEAAANALPANLGRSGMVHGLIRALNLLDMGDREGSAEGEADSDVDAGNHGRFPVRRLRIIPPDPALGTPAELRRYHAPRYVEYLLRARGEGGTSSSDGDSSGSGSSSEDGGGRRKRRRTMGLEYDCPPFPLLRVYAPLVAAATLTACRALVRGDARVVVVWDGGRHHAARARASGFCYVADAVLGILLLAREGRPWVPPGNGGSVDGRAHEKVSEQDSATNSDELQSSATTRPSPPPPSAASTAPAPRSRRPRIFYLDMDLHYGDGVSQAFASPAHFLFPLGGRRVRAPQVLTLSIHHAARVFFPPGAPDLTRSDTPHPFSLALPLAAFAHAPTYARLWVAVEQIKDAWDPDYVVLQLGVDGLPSDPIGQWGAWSPHGQGGSTWVTQQVLAWNRPTAVLGGGGYNHPNAARAWALATAAVAAHPLDKDTVVPDHPHWHAYAPSFTLEVPESDAPDETTDQDIEDALREFKILAGRIREIVAQST